MDLTLYVVIAGIAPVLLIALAVERFSYPKESTLSTVLTINTLAALTIAEFFSLWVIATGMNTRTP